MSQETPPGLPGWLTVVIGLVIAMNAAAGAGHAAIVPASQPTTGCTSSYSASTLGVVA